jgi:hypothetical protein
VPVHFFPMFLALLIQNNQYHHVPQLFFTDCNNYV